MIRTVLGLDIGTSAVKAILLDEAGAVRGKGRQTYPTRHAAEGLSEQAPRDWLDAATSAIRQAVADDIQVEAISVSGHMSAPVLVDAGGTSLAACHTITDTRAVLEIAPECRFEIEARTGNLCAAYFSLPKLLWWRRHHPEVFARTACLLAPKDFVTGWLTGILASDPTDAGNVLLLDPVTRRWMPDISRHAGIDPALLPRLFEPGTRLGSLRSEIAATLGLRGDIPVAMGAADMAAALLGTALADDEIAVTIGTSATVIARVRAIDPSLIGKVTFHPGASPGSLFALGSHFNGGACLDWMGTILGGPARLREAEHAAGDLEGQTPLFVPYLLGSGSPDFDADARGAFYGLSAQHGPAHLLRAVVEGISADLCLSLDLLDPDGARRIALAGGGANLRIWPQIMADLARRPVVLADHADASTIGAALLAGRCVGWFTGLPAPRTATFIPPGASDRPDALRRRFAHARDQARHGGRP